MAELEIASIARDASGSFSDGRSPKEDAGPIDIKIANKPCKGAVPVPASVPTGDNPYTASDKEGALDGDGKKTTLMTLTGVSIRDGRAKIAEKPFIAEE